MMRSCLTGVLVSIILLWDCSAQSQECSVLRIRRFDTDLHRLLNHQTPQEVFISEYGAFIDLFGKQIIDIGGIDSVGFFDRLHSFFSEPTLKNLYQDEQQNFSDITAIEKELSEGFGVLLKEFPSMSLPEIYMHVSGLNQNVIVGDHILSISVDKYMGSDYPLYQQFFYDYQLVQMRPDRMVPDYLLGWMMTEFPFQGNEDVLLDRMIYEGKLRFILTRLLPERQVWEYVGYSKEQYLWCSNNKKSIWKSILSNQHLYKADYLVTSQYLKDAPYTAFLTEKSPARVGVWVGYQIVISFMKNNPDTSLQDLINRVDYQEFLKQSKYKP